MTGDKYAQYADIPLVAIPELLIYRDAVAELAWDSDEADSPVNSMLYFIRSENAITVVLDDPNTAEMRLIMRSLQASLHAAVASTK